MLCTLSCDPLNAAALGKDRCSFIPYMDSRACSSLPHVLI